jgi:DNA polymerase III epsilon subunit-like protein
LRLSRRLDPDRQLTHGLADLCARYDVPIERPHDALCDARATAAVLPHLLVANGVVDAADLESLYTGRPPAADVV